MSGDLDPELKKLFSLAIKKLSLREHSRGEMQRYLQTKKTLDTDQVQIDVILKQLEEMDLLSDQRFVKAFISGRRNKGKGPLLIKRELQFKGLDNELIHTELAQIEDEEWLKTAQLLLDKKKRQFNHLNGLLRTQKIKQILYNRGFESRVINAVIDDER